MRRRYRPLVGGSRRRFRRRRFRMRGGTSPGFARFLKDKLCKLRCR